jgi:hypothetical protein
MFNVLALMMMEARGFGIPTPPSPPNTPSQALTSDFSDFNDECDKLVKEVCMPFNDNIGGSEDAIPKEKQ